MPLKTSPMSYIFNKVMNIIHILLIYGKTKYSFENGYWLEAKNVTKKGPETFIRQLNRYNSYHRKEKNRTFTHALYIPTLGYSLINFLNKKLSDQFYYEAQGVNLDQSDTESESDNDDDSEDTNDGIEVNYDEKTMEYNKYKEIGEESPLNEEELEIEKNTDNFPCEISKKDIDILKFFSIIRQKLQNIDISQRQYYIFLFYDTENAENYFSPVEYSYN